MNNIKKCDRARPCFGEADFEGEKFKYPGGNSLKTLLYINHVYLAGSVTTQLINYIRSLLKV